jgi:hypothetical protein
MPGIRSGWKSGSMTAILLLVILVGMGEKMAERFLPLYLLARGGVPGPSAS